MSRLQQRLRGNRARSARAARGARLARAAVGALTAALAAAVCLAGQSQASTLFFPRALAEETNALYSHNCFWGGPRGMDYAALSEPQPIQVPNLYPDKGSTYFVAQFEMPEGSSLTIHGTYPRERYFSFTVANELANGVVGNGDFVRDEQVEPDPGSVNPYQITATKNDRRPAGQTYTLHVVRGPIPAQPAANTLYTTSTSATAPIRLAMRNYIPDEGLTGTGGVELPTVTLTLADGEEIAEAGAVCAALHNNKEATVTGFPQATWEKQIAKSSEPTNAPVKSTAPFELFWNNNYNIIGQFAKTPLERVEKYPATPEGGYATNPDTEYAVAALSLNFGNVVVVRGKLPTYQHTRPHASQWSSTDPQVRYWSICTAQGPVSGKGSDCAYDQQVPLNSNGDYTIVISKLAHRPANASTMCGVKWLNFGPGEGEIEGTSPPDRSWVGVVYVRFMDALSGAAWPQSPKNVPEPTKSNPNNELANVMGEYAPVAEYTSQEAYEATGCGAGAPKLAAPAGTPNKGAFTLDWSAPTNSLPQLYTLQQEQAGGKWETVASGLRSPEYTFPSGSPEAQGTWTYRVGAIDEGASETAPEEGDYGPASEPVKVDRTAPGAPTAIVSRAPDYAGDGGWYKGSVIVSFAAGEDPTLPDGSEGSGVEPSSLTSPQTIEGSGSHEVCGTVADRAGNTSAPGCVTVQVDATPPTVAVACPASAELDSSGAAANVTAFDGQSGLAQDPSGTIPISTSSLGEQTTTATAIDNVGYETSQSCTTDVVYSFSKLKPKNDPRVKPGRSLTVGFHLADALGYVTDASATLEVAPAGGSFRPATSSSDSGDRFANEKHGNYTYALSTSGLSAGAWTLRVNVSDGTSHETTIAVR